MKKKMNDKQMWDFFNSLTETNDYTVTFFQKIPKKCVEDDEEFLAKLTKDGTWYDDTYSEFEKGYYYFAQCVPLKLLKIMFTCKPHVKSNIILACIKNNKGDKYINEKY